MAEKVMKVRENKVVDGELTVIHRETGADCVLFDDGETFQGKFDAGELVGPPGKDGAAGSPGANGKDGFSPTVTTSKSGTVTTVTVTDADGAHNFEISDGKDGAVGPVGPAGPNTVGTDTGTDISGLLMGNGKTVKTAVPNTDYLPVEDPEAAGSLSVTEEDFSMVFKARDALNGVPVSTITAAGVLVLMSAMKQIIVGAGIDPLTTFGGFFLNQNTVGLGNDGLAGQGHCQSFGAITEPEDITTKEYVDDAVFTKANKPTLQTIKLTQSGWGSGNTQTVSCSGIVTDETKQIVDISPAVSDYKAYCDAGCYVSSIAEDELTFTCGTAPGADLTVYVSIQNVG